ncbi:MAG: NUDIX domain-containing protein [Clostridiales bacterium]|nr:NUDIX domain-containing protein [Clostridiales bacterium]
MELRDLYDKNLNLTGETIQKGEIIPKGKYILVVVVWIQNCKGELLIQQRSFTKNSYPGKWATTGGHPKHGETSLQGMITETSEELGVVLQENELEYIKTCMDDDTFIDIYYTNKDLEINDMILQKEEVEAVKWVSIEEFEKMISNNEVASSHFELYEEIKELLKSRC